jgi:hypothetical protein
MDGFSTTRPPLKAACGLYIPTFSYSESFPLAAKEKRSKTGIPTLKLDYIKEQGQPYQR